MKNLIAINWSKIFLWIFGGTFVLGQLQKYIITDPINLYLHDILILFWILGYLLTNFSKWRRELISFPKLKSGLWKTLQKFHWELGLILWLIIGMLMAFLQTGDLKPFLYFSRAIIYLFFVYSIQDVFKRSSFFLQKFWFAIGFLFLSLGFLQYLLIPDTRFLAIMGWDDHFFRLIGTLLDPGVMGAILLVYFIYLQGLNWLKKRTSLYLIVSTFLIMAISLTFSRATYLALMFVILLLGFFQFQLKNNYFSASSKLINPYFYLIFISFVFVFALLLSPKPSGEGIKLDRTSSIQARIDTFNDYRVLIKMNDSFLGNGIFSSPNKEVVRDSNITFQIPFHAHHPDNIFILFLYGSGWLGLTLFCIIMVRLFLRFYIKQPMIALTIITLIVLSQFNHILFEPFVWLFSWGSLSMLDGNKHKT